MSNHQPTTEDLIRLAAGELTPEESARLRDAILSTPGLAEQLATVESIVAFLREEPTTAPSDSALRSARELLKRQRPGVVETLRQGVRRIVAALDFDTRLPAAGAGFRGSASAVQIGFSSDACEIDLELQQTTHNTWLCRGQIDSRLAAPLSVTLLDATGRPVANTPDAGDDGAFQALVHAGSYTLVIESADVRVEAGPLLVP